MRLDIDGRTVLHRSVLVAPDHSSFQPISLGRSFMEDPCKQHNRSLQSPRATVPTPPPAFPREVHSLLLLFLVVFTYTRTGRQIDFRSTDFVQNLIHISSSDDKTVPNIIHLALYFS
ncbi:hypothetical protein AVEN_88609-1 [Araneus ventricosus]|uniref:Uncharacterized protein n=1 Tax=Araneus ventricosus TaxID=182803 RepID=A0A4Y2FRN6_ARAVE|nr:hypothetical protein AVEN_88609-1 [Araneus ventricosus]